MMILIAIVVVVIIIIMTGRKKIHPDWLSGGKKHI